MSEHTPTPWKVEADQHFGPGFVITAKSMGNRCPVIRMSSPLGEEDPTLAGDAALIVKAVNNHDALVAALEFIRDGYDNQDVGHVDYRVKAYQVALDALASVGPTGKP